MYKNMLQKVTSTFSTKASIKHRFIWMSSGLPLPLPAPTPNPDFEHKLEIVSIFFGSALVLESTHLSSS
jgi:hypothetical protein